MFICRVQDLKELGDLSPHWDNLRKEVMTRYAGIISSYQETLAEMDKINGMITAPISEFDIPVCVNTCSHAHKCEVRQIHKLASKLLVHTYISHTDI